MVMNIFVHVTSNTCHLFIYGMNICCVPIKIQAPYKWLERKKQRGEKIKFPYCHGIFVTLLVRSTNKLVPFKRLN